MTLLPSDEFGITGWPGNLYDVNEICAHPTCSRRSVHAHHMWPRSFIRKNYDWVRLPDGTILGNRIGLCQEHHDMVTGEIGGYRARLRWDAGIMWWDDKRKQVGGGTHPVDWVRSGPLSTQPPVASRIAVTESISEDMRSAVIAEHAHGHVGDDEKVCPVCGHHKQQKQPKAKLERRNTKQWVVTVPDDAEVGTDVLDSIIEDLAIPIGATEWSSRLRRYYVLAMALAWVNQNRTEFIADLAEAAERRTAA
jgi:hypothetical protein